MSRRPHHVTEWRQTWAGRVARMRRYESRACARDVNSRAARHKKVTFIGVLYQQRAAGDGVPTTKLAVQKKKIAVMTRLIG